LSFFAAMGVELENEREAERAFGIVELVRD
jgi:hypothetical protein